MDRYADGKMTEHLDLSRSINDPMDIHTSKIKEFLGGIMINRHAKTSTRAWGEEEDNEYNCVWCNDSGCYICMPYDDHCSFCFGVGCHLCNGIGLDHCNICGGTHSSSSGCPAENTGELEEPSYPIFHYRCRTILGYISGYYDPNREPIEHFCPKCNMNFWY